MVLIPCSRSELYLGRGEEGGVKSQGAKGEKLPASKRREIKGLRQE